MAKKAKKQNDDAAGTLRDGEIKTPIFRAGYIAMPDDDGYYTITAIFPDGTNLKEMEKLAKTTLKEEFGGNMEVDDYAWPLHDGDKRARKKNQPHYADATYCNIKSRYAPEVIVDAKGNEIDINETSELYAGAWYRAVITCYAYTNKDNDGCSFGLQDLQKIRDDEKVKAGGRSKEQARALFDDGVAETYVSKDKSKKDKKKKKKDK